LSEKRLFGCLKKIELCAKTDIMSIIYNSFVAFRENFSGFFEKSPVVFRESSGDFEITPGDFPENTG
jgi:hypothetical protein